MIRHALTETSMGWVGIAMSAQGVRALTLPAASRQEASDALARACPRAEAAFSDSEASAIAGRLRAFVEGASPGLELPLDLVGTDFQRQVWRAISDIPRGETRSYAWIANRIGRPKAVRAVGQAVGANPVPLLVPCHRVIASNGALGGFAGGLPLKRALLLREGVAAAGPS